MKTTLIVSLMAAGLMLLAFAGTSPQSAVADNPEPVGTIIAEESGQLEALFAQGTPGDADSPEIAGFYHQLRQLAKDYIAAKTADEKTGITNRADKLMAQLFDFKVQREEKRIAQLQRRLNQSRDRLKDMQLHKLDLVHKAVQKTLSSGGQEMPEWATPSR